MQIYSVFLLIQFSVFNGTSLKPSGSSMLGTARVCGGVKKQSVFAESPPHPWGIASRTALAPAPARNDVGLVRHCMHQMKVGLKNVFVIQ